MDCALDDIIQSNKGKFRATRSQQQRPKPSDFSVPDTPVKKTMSKEEKIDKMSSSLDDVIAADRQMKRERKGGKGKGSSFNQGSFRQDDGRKGQQFFRDSADRPNNKGAAKGGFSRNYTNAPRSQPYSTFGDRYLNTDWDFTDHRGQTKSPPRARQGTFGRRILVENIPRNLDSKDLEEAFLEVGKVHHVEVEGGKAWVIFASSKEAYEAEHRYDGGQINKQTIRVSVQ
eukprot:GEMP01025077.1.p1 GENE.GEMP01025077.1~~GEMP01025077.1.p1  ORF type:complete len:229 (+),score=54.96 GEMP01025077.1:59-745(+)